MLRDLIPSTPRSLMRGDSFSSLRRAMDRLLEDFTSDFGELTPSTWSQPLRSFMPRIDLEERDNEIVMTAELPGMTDKDVQVEMSKDYLTIKGEKKSEREEEDEDRTFCERSYGSFERTILLPSEVNKDKIEAAVKDGVLTVKIPRTAKPKDEVKKIPVHH